MKFKELLKIIKDFDGELRTDEFDSRFSFCWGDSEITKEGELKFKEIMNSDVTIDKEVLILKNDNITEENFDLFMSAVAGYVNENDYNKWFKSIGVEE